LHIKLRAREKEHCWFSTKIIFTSNVVDIISKLQAEKNTDIILISLFADILNLEQFRHIFDNLVDIHQLSNPKKAVDV